MGRLAADGGGLGSGPCACLRVPTSFQSVLRREQAWQGKDSARRPDSPSIEGSVLIDSILDLCVSVQMLMCRFVCREAFDLRHPSRICTMSDGPLFATTVSPTDILRDITLAAIHNLPVSASSELAHRRALTLRFQ